MSLLLLSTTGGALGQAARPAGRPAAATPPASVPATPQQTTATFGDWILRCARPAGAPKTCEVAQLVQQDGKPVAQVAIGAVSKGRPMQLTVLVPTSVSLGKAPVLMRDDDGDGITLAWQRCLPGGCIAETEIGEDKLSRLRTASQPARIAYVDALGRRVELPFSPVGLRQALDALAKEGGDG